MRRTLLHFSPLFLTGCLLLGSGGTNPWNAQRNSQRQFAKEHVVGAELTPDARHSRVHEMRVRIWAANGYRRGKVHWQRKADQLIERANRYLGPTFGVRLVVVGANAWSTDDQADLRHLLSDLRRADDGQDVDWVIGLAPASAGAIADFSQLGLADTPGQHFVIRDTNDPAEQEWIDRNLSELSTEERAQAFASRRDHKSTSVFLHEWGHSLGALHSHGTDDIMASHYEPAQARFASADIATIEDGLGARGRTYDHGPTRPGAVGSSLPLELLRIGVTPDSPKLSQRDAYKTAFYGVYKHYRSRDLRAARRSLREARSRVPAAGWHQLECEIELLAQRTASARRACKKALAAFSGLPRAHYLLGLLEADRNRPRAARRHLRRTVELDPGGPHDAAARLSRLSRQSRR